MNQFKKILIYRIGNVSDIVCPMPVMNGSSEAAFF